jgi:hypothetical protein
VQAPTIRFASEVSGDVESVSPAAIEVVVDNGEAGVTYTVSYAVIGGTAAEGDDYTLVEPETLTFHPDETSKTISIGIINDGTDEDDETIVLELSGPAATAGGVELGDPRQHTYTIIDPRPRIGFDTAAGSGREDVQIIHRPREIPVSLSHAVDWTVNVDYGITGGTAAGGGEDYELVNGGVLTFQPGQLTRSISIDMIDDDLAESDETIVLMISNPVNARLGTNIQHTYTIIDDEANVPPPNKDINSDGVVDWEDARILISNWLECSLNPPELCWQ